MVILLILILLVLVYIASVQFVENRNSVTKMANEVNIANEQILLLRGIKAVLIEIADKDK
jgi:hypothetical protein